MTSVYFATCCVGLEHEVQRDCEEVLNKLLSERGDRGETEVKGVRGSGQVFIKCPTSLPPRLLIQHFFSIERLFLPLLSVDGLPFLKPLRLPDREKMRLKTKRTQTVHKKNNPSSSLKKELRLQYRQFMDDQGEQEQESLKEERKRLAEERARQEKEQEKENEERKKAKLCPILREAITSIPISVWTNTFRIWEETVLTSPDTMGEVDFVFPNHHSTSSQKQKTSKNTSSSSSSSTGLDIPPEPSIINPSDIKKLYYGPQSLDPVQISTLPSEMDFGFVPNQNPFSPSLSPFSFQFTSNDASLITKSPNDGIRHNEMSSSSSSIESSSGQSSEFCDPSSKSIFSSDLVLPAVPWHLLPPPRIFGDEGLGKKDRERLWQEDHEETTKTQNGKEKGRAPSFRVTIERTGNKGDHCLPSISIAAFIGGGIVDRFGWKVDLVNYDVEVWGHVRGNHLILGIPLSPPTTKLHLRSRRVFGETSLLPSIAYTFSRMSKIQVGDIVMDPMCGGGTIPIEAALSWRSASYFGGEKYKETVPKTLINKTFALSNFEEKTGRKDAAPIELMRWDLTAPAMRRGCVDVIVCDMPFGVRSGSHKINTKLYPKLFKHISLLLRPNGRALLLTLERKLVTCILKNSPLVLINFYSIDMGGMALIFYELQKPSNSTSSLVSNQQQ